LHAGRSAPVLFLLEPPLEIPASISLVAYTQIIMKYLRLILVAGTALTTLSSLRADDTLAREATKAAVDRSYQWVSHYYENPRPDDLLSSVYTLSRAGYFEASGQPATAIGFFSVVFAQNPQRVSS